MEAGRGRYNGNAIAIRVAVTVNSSISIAWSDVGRKTKSVDGKVGERKAANSEITRGNEVVSEEVVDACGSSCESEYGVAELVSVRQSTAVGGTAGSVRIATNGHTDGRGHRARDPCAYGGTDAAESSGKERWLASFMQLDYLRLFFQKEAAAQQSTSKKTPPKRAAVSKEPQHMTPDELIEFRNRDPRQWDRFTRQNTIYSYGVSTPTSEDVEQGRKLSQKKRANKVTFDTEIDVVRAPAGRDFQFNEETDRSTSILRK